MHGGSNFFLDNPYAPWVVDLVFELYLLTSWRLFALLWTGSFLKITEVSSASRNNNYQQGLTVILIVRAGIWIRQVISSSSSLCPLIASRFT